MRKWYYDKDGKGKIFEGDAPEGWLDHPDDHKKAIKTEEKPINVIKQTKKASPKKKGK